jgi:chlorophyllide a reductase subunit Y
MCPAFGSLRVGLRMRRTATILSGSACCVYGLTFTSHFYGARRSVGYVPFNSESLVTGKLFEDIREAVYAQADPALYDAIVIINLCVPTASGVPLQILPKQINGVRIIGIDVPGFGVPTHAEAKDVLAGAMLKYARAEAMKPARCRHRAGPGRRDKPAGHVAGRNVPGRPDDHRHDARADGPGRRPGGADARMARAVCRAGLCSRGGRHPPVLHRQRARVRRRRPPGGGLGTGGPRRHRSLAAGRREAANVAQDKIDAAKNRFLPAIKGALARTPIKGRITLSGYEGSELLVARLLVESGADLRYVGTACPRTVWSDADREWLEARGVQVQYRASLEQDLAAMREFQARPGHRHHSGGAGGQGSCAFRRCTSPT